jgi:hypothetical protein
MRTTRMVCLAAGALLVGLSQLGATMLEQLELGDLVLRSDRIFRGTVIDVEQSAVEAGGGELPMVIYRLRVEESFKGEPDLVKGGVGYAEIRMVGSLKTTVSRGELAHFSVFRDVPRLSMGGDYLLFVTPASAIGLSTTVGLGQGAFSVFEVNKEEYVVNQFNNQGLGLDGAAVPYGELVARVKALMGS